MNILVLGSGGREHALCWKLARSPQKPRVLAAPGSDGMARDADCHPAVSAGDVDAVLALARRERVDLVVVGPEDPLAAGIADRLRAEGIATFGPSAAAARLESSKAFAKEFMRRHRIPTAAHAVFDDLAAARAHVRAIAGPCVVKADGLAAGKGVAVCDGPADAERALDEAMGERRFGAAGARVVVEERLFGEEASYYALSDGTNVVPLAAAQDHKRALDGDRGENTGGMGAYSPAAVFSGAVEKRVLEEVVHPTVRGMAAEGHPFQGVLFVGLMIGADGAPRVIEFNVRFGDPETQPVMLRLQSDLVDLIEAAIAGRLHLEHDVQWDPRASLGVVMAAEGYPGTPRTGDAINAWDSP
ncbi:MAG TPA: phosphoribosylamine--glycine ligase, partial [Myxococcota bacterium]|nr:phosphoribosylamine--glycine ligase [Myxococcota bacterium]